MLSPFVEACELRELTVRGDVSPREVAEFFLARIDRLKSQARRFHDRYAATRA